MNLELVAALGELEKERGIPKEVLLRLLRLPSSQPTNATTAPRRTACRGRRQRQHQSLSRKDVVEEVLEEANEISLEDAKAIDANYQLDDVVEIEGHAADFGASPLRPLASGYPAHP